MRLGDPLRGAMPFLLVPCLLLIPVQLGAQQKAQRPRFTMKVKSEVVLVNVSVRDKKGNFVSGLTAKDFTVLEDGKPQHVSHFEVENVDAIPNPPPVPANLLTSQASPSVSSTPSTASPAETSSQGIFKDRRLIVFFFDLTSLQPEDLDRAVAAAESYVAHEMAPADVVAIVSLSSALNVDQDFTTDRAALLKVLQSYTDTGAQGYEEGATGTTEGTPDTGAAFTPDETEYNIFNTDHRLEAIRSIAEQLAPIKEKKSLVYFSSGMDRTGIENESELRATANAAIRANLSIYTMDMRGLQAIVPGGEAQSASLRGVSVYSGAATRNALNSNFTSQETLVSMADDTGGRAFLDTNDFAKAFRQIQQDTETYYMLGYQSTNHARDGRYRHITVRVDRPGLKLVYSRGYYAPTDFQHTNRSDREAELREALASPLAETDFPLFLSTGYFRTGKDRYFVPVSLAIPGWDIPITEEKDKDKVSLDVMGWVEDQKQFPFQQVRDTIKLQTEASEQIRQKNVQYDTGFVLPPGKYHLKFVVRENETGRMASFETDLNIPNLAHAPLKMSSVILSNQIKPSKRHVHDDPLLRHGTEIVPNVTHVFSSRQKLYVFYQLYDPGEEAEKAATGKNESKEKEKSTGIRVLTNASFFQGNRKVYESPLLTVKRADSSEHDAANLHLEIPLDKLKPGFYICQVNVIDDASGRFAFPRLALLVR